MRAVSYETIARFYDAVMGDRTETAGHVRHLIAQHKPEARTLLELACGTGAVLRILARSYEVAGLDVSPRMLSMARKKLPRVRFFRQNMISFDLGKKFDVIICVFDSINHVLRFADWKSVFRRAAAHLDEKGIFLFDVNTMEKLQRHMRTPPRVTAFGRNWLIMSVTDRGRGVANWTIKIFEHKGRGSYRVFEENIREVSFPVKKIRDALRRQFKSVKIVDPLAARPSRRSDRLYFVCRR
jgi:ubiquinone/menaquinone biosynthesis C-methylase UbiE